MKHKTQIMIGIIAIFVILLAACENDARIASQNISKAADNFEVARRVIFYNGINGEYLLEIEGRCSIRHDTIGQNSRHDQLEVTCKLGHERFIKHFLGLSDNVTYFAEQIKTINVSTYHYRVTFKPQVIIPDIDFRFSGEELITDKSEDQRRQSEQELRQQQN